jgi:hypothetical protein
VIVFGAAILMDTREKTIFPRWFGYHCILVGTLLTPGTFNVFFKHGVLAWDGLLSFYEPIITFSIWLVVAPIMLNRAVDHQLAEEVAAPPAEDPALVHAELARLRHDLDRLTAHTGELTSLRS